MKQIIPAEFIELCNKLDINNPDHIILVKRAASYLGKCKNSLDRNNANKFMKIHNKIIKLVKDLETK